MFDKDLAAAGKTLLKGRKKDGDGRMDRFRSLGKIAKRELWVLESRLAAL
jgi:hypothetical protein